MRKYQTGSQETEEKVLHHSLSVGQSGSKTQNKISDSEMKVLYLR